MIVFNNNNKCDKLFFFKFALNAKKKKTKKEYFTKIKS